ncbi:exodeoxyribonuclease III [Priestia flexa]|jgi:exodeoxyribonuclease III|uniref:Exodeoxyribonuclease III n=1 Tax=Priestia flexa TaxID=86664 RepID=A0A8I1MFS5_9BACI|nr:exodeoxyribonuclease III [Priestia flexa]MBN8251399.1 exodeoxyribonuclease III [Priestia flexa]MBN8434337.1 exodeoxyribonuclease III [Priestia flexa]MCA0966878.1 exodeoxyribonuclease III [Priestia flexa]RIV10193.1 exodeoxyribonuclease III [Priestia flexa]UIR31705.1 exodeoxyribonuclease III [Priestia flexa]
MKLVSWNVNGLRACVKKGFMDYFHEVDADLFCIQETKLQEGQIDLVTEGYHQYWNYAEKKGYSGTAIFTKKKPLGVTYGIRDFEDLEGRVITLEFEELFVVTMYTPNAKRDLTRLAYRLEWEDAVRSYLIELNQQKPVVFCGDLNVAHTPLDLRNDKSNKGNSGFTTEEREKMTQLLAEGFVDAFRYLHPNQEGMYTWWSYMSTVRERNIGWRIDYFLISEQLKSRLKCADIHSNILGSDHCPVVIELI